MKIPAYNSVKSYEPPPIEFDWLSKIGHKISPIVGNINSANLI